MKGGVTSISEEPENRLLSEEKILLLMSESAACVFQQLLINNLTQSVMFPEGQNPALTHKRCQI